MQRETTIATDHILIFFIFQKCFSNKQINFLLQTWINKAIQNQTIERERKIIELQPKPWDWLFLQIIFNLIFVYLYATCVVFIAALTRLAFLYFLFFFTTFHYLVLLLFFIEFWLCLISQLKSNSKERSWTSDACDTSNASMMCLNVCVSVYLAEEQTVNI